MKTEQLKKLAAAGFTLEQIIQIAEMNFESKPDNTYAQGYAEGLRDAKRFDPKPGTYPDFLDKMEKYRASKDKQFSQKMARYDEFDIKMQEIMSNYISTLTSPAWILSNNPFGINDK